ncbi:type III effector HrpK domain-containing protein [Dickeya dianthicola]|uniref:type III effector HrpK domain-containing protein n=1 Tax=Dickeya dianthicola TaxID=204039 RepID=UPI00301AC10A
MITASAFGPLLSPELQDAARLWSHPGLFSLLEHADVKGEKLARVPHDGKLSAGEAAGAAAASAVGAAAGPVGWAVSGALSIGMGIAELVNFFKAKSKFKHRRADFANTVNPILTQFNIPKPR